MTHNEVRALVSNVSNVLSKMNYTAMWQDLDVATREYDSSIRAIKERPESVAMLLTAEYKQENENLAKVATTKYKVLLARLEHSLYALSKEVQELNNSW